MRKNISSHSQLCMDPPTTHGRLDDTIGLRLEMP